MLASELFGSLEAWATGQDHEPHRVQARRTSASPGTTADTGSTMTASSRSARSSSEWGTTQALCTCTSVTSARSGDSGPTTMHSGCRETVSIAPWRPYRGPAPGTRVGSGIPTQGLEQQRVPDSDHVIAGPSGILGRHMNFQREPPVLLDGARDKAC